MNAAEYLRLEERRTRARLTETGSEWKGAAGALVREHPGASTVAGFCAGLGAGWLSAPGRARERAPGRRGVLAGLAGSAAGIAKLSVVRWAAGLDAPEGPA
jgi:hypothetical protein